jgi:hypothetical protein
MSFRRFLLVQLNAGPVSVLGSTVKMASRRNRSSVQPNKQGSTEGHRGKLQSCVFFNFNKETLLYNYIHCSFENNNSKQITCNFRGSPCPSTALLNLLWGPCVSSSWDVCVVLLVVGVVWCLELSCGNIYFHDVISFVYKCLLFCVMFINCYYQLTGTPLATRFVPLNAVALKALTTT